MELTIEDMIERSHGDHNAALLAARHLEGWRFSYRENGVSHYWMPGVHDNVALPVLSHKECMDIIEQHRPGTLMQAFDCAL